MLSQGLLNPHQHGKEKKFKSCSLDLEDFFIEFGARTSEPTLGSIMSKDIKTPMLKKRFTSSIKTQKTIFFLTRVIRSVNDEVAEKEKQSNIFFKMGRNEMKLGDKSSSPATKHLERKTSVPDEVGDPFYKTYFLKIVALQVPLPKEKV